MTTPAQGNLDSQVLATLMHSVDEIKQQMVQISVGMATLTEKVGNLANNSATEKAEMKARIAELEGKVAAHSQRMADYDTVKRLVYGLVLAIMAAIGSTVWSNVMSK